MKRISRRIAVFALLGTGACAADGPLAPQLSPEPEDGHPTVQADVTPSTQSSRPPSVILRCGGSISAQGAPPIYVVDGVILPDDSLRNLDPASIVSIEITRTDNEFAVSGARVARPVVFIRTRAGG